jgi:ParB family chromosome partitioning protein
MRASEGDSALEQAWVLRELLERHGLVAGELARRFDKTTSWVSRRLALVVNPRRAPPDAERGA